MPTNPLFAWDGQEYSFEERGSDWYWALGIITVAATLTAILFSNILLALVILTGAGTIAAQAAKHRRLHHFAIYENGLAIDNNLYFFKDMRDFGILEYLDPELPPALSIKTNHILAPHLLVPIHGYDPEDIYDFVSLHLPQGDHEQTLIDHVMTLLRF